MNVRVVSSSPLPEAERIDVVNLDSAITDAQCSDVFPGGFGGLNLGYKNVLGGEVSGTLANPIDFVDLGHIQVFEKDENGFLIFEGRIKDIDSPTGRQATAVTATGYGTGEMAATKDMWYFSDPYEAEPAIGGGQLLREILKAAAPLLKIGDKDQFYEPGGRYLRSSESGRYPSSVVDEVVKAGDFNNNQAFFAVYEDRVVQLLPRVPPTDPASGRIVADYYVPADRRRVTWRRSGSLMVGVVAVQFKDPSSATSDHTSLSSIAEQDAFRDAHGGILRGFIVPQSSWSQEQAEFFRDSYLQKYKSPVLTVMVNADDKGWPVFNRLGGVIPSYQCRAGSWIQIAEEAPLMVTSTRKDLRAGTVSLVASNV